MDGLRFTINNVILATNTHISALILMECSRITTSLIMTIGLHCVSVSVFVYFSDLSASFH